MAYTCKSLIRSTNDGGRTDKRLSVGLRDSGFVFVETTPDGSLVTFGDVVGEHSRTMTTAISDVKGFFSELDIRPLGYQSMELVVICNENVWIPDELYSSVANRQYLKAVGGKATSIFTAHSKELSSTAVFSANDQLIMAFKVALPGLSVVNQHIKMASLASRSAAHPILVSHWHDNYIDLAALQGGKYVYGNTIRFENDDEARFRIIEAIKTFGMESNATELLLCGEVDRNRYAALSPYFPKVSLFSGRDIHFSNPELKKVHTYKYALMLM